ncbi:hypothetical protein TRVL_03567 [Trypanosoma vivax]|nr:hypothetical protein TRVL_03567 [Trypanosoma vivax]
MSMSRDGDLKAVCLSVCVWKANGVRVLLWIIRDSLAVWDLIGEVGPQEATCAVLKLFFTFHGTRAKAEQMWQKTSQLEGRISGAVPSYHCCRLRVAALLLFKPTLTHAKKEKMSTHLLCNGDVT